MQFLYWRALLVFQGLIISCFFWCLFVALQVLWYYISQLFCSLLHSVATRHPEHTSSSTAPHIRWDRYRSLKNPVQRQNTRAPSTLLLHPEGEKPQVVCWLPIPPGCAGCRMPLLTFLWFQQHPGNPPKSQNAGCMLPFSPCIWKEKSEAEVFLPGSELR